MRSHLHKDRQNTDGLKAQLETLCTDLWWSSESDYPVEIVWQSASKTRGGIDETTVRNLADLAKNVTVQIANVEDFFERQTTPQSWHTAEDKVQLDKLQQLKSLLTSSLINFQVYRCGETEIKVYAIGKTPDGHIAGVKTILVET